MIVVIWIQPHVGMWVLGYRCLWGLASFTTDRLIVDTITRKCGVIVMDSRLHTSKSEERSV